MHTYVAINKSNIRTYTLHEGVHENKQSVLMVTTFLRLTSSRDIRAQLVQYNYSLDLRFKCQSGSPIYAYVLSTYILCSGKPWREKTLENLAI